MNSFLQNGLIYVFHTCDIRKAEKTIKNFRFPKLYPYKKIMKVITQTQYKSKLTITLKTPILAEINIDPCRMEEVWNIMQQETSQSETDVNHDQDLVRRRAILATQFQALPIYGSAEFWSLVEEPQLKLALPSITDHRHRVGNAPSNVTLHDSSRKGHHIYQSHAVAA